MPENNNTLEQATLPTADDHAAAEGRARYFNESTVLVNSPLAKKKEKDLLPDDELTDSEREMFTNIEKKEETRSERELNYQILHNVSNTFYGFLADKEPFPDILNMMKSGNFTASLKKRYMVKAIDESWVAVVEESLQALDAMIRRPGKFIEQREELMPIELSRNISSRSIQHLSQHTNLISKIEGDNITPTKILNVFHDETLFTYENKFVNTLLNRLYIFVMKRYDAAQSHGKDEKRTHLEFSGDFNYGGVKGNMSFEIEVSEPPEENSTLKNYRYTSDIWERVEKLYGIIRGYSSSDFAKAMGKAYIRPPVMHTNAILKNKNLKQCLALWEYIESYESVGYDMLVQEDAEKLSDEYVQELFNSVAIMYVNFRHNLRDNLRPEEAVLNTEQTDDTITPKFVSEILPITAEQFNVTDTKYEKHVVIPDGISAEGLEAVPEVQEAIDVALAADAIFRQRIKEAEERRIEQARQAELAEQKRLEEEEERHRAEEAEKRAAKERELMRLKAEQMAKEEAEKAAQLAKEEAEKAEAERIAAQKEAERKRRNAIPRKKKKNIRRAAEKEAQKQGVELPKTFDFDTYTEYVKK